MSNIDFNRLDELKEKLASFRPLNAAELKQIRDEFIIENTYNSNAIEGSTLTLRETALILQEGLTISEKPIREHLEAIGHKDAFEYIVSLADAKERLSEKVIKDVHSLVLMNDAINKGVYRRVPVKILGSSHVPPPPYLVREQLQEQLEEYELMKPKLHIVEAAALFHLRFESIHPFIDGNGRTGRLIMNLELIKAGFLPVNVKFTERARYYECFDSYYANNSYDALTDLIAKYEIYELENRISILEAANNF